MKDWPDVTSSRCTTSLPCRIASTDCRAPVGLLATGRDSATQPRTGSPRPTGERAVHIIVPGCTGGSVCETLLVLEPGNMNYREAYEASGAQSYTRSRVWISILRIGNRIIAWNRCTAHSGRHTQRCRLMTGDGVRYDAFRLNGVN